MPAGTPVNRQWIIVLENGTPILDWKEGLGVNLLTGEYIQYPRDEYTHPIQDDDLETLKRAGRVASYDHRQVYVIGLPETPSGSSV